MVFWYPIVFCMSCHTTSSPTTPARCFTMICVRSRNFVWGFLVVTLLFAGCGGSSDPSVKVHPVSGKITFEGQPTPNAIVVLHPQSPPQTTKPIVSMATVQSDGTFKIGTMDEADGAPVGEYVVTVTWRKEATGGNVLPPKYADPATSDTKVTVKEGQNELPPIELKK